MAAVRDEAFLASAYAFELCSVAPTKMGKFRPIIVIGLLISMTGVFCYMSGQHVAFRRRSSISCRAAFDPRRVESGGRGVSVGGGGSAAHRRRRTCS